MQIQAVVTESSERPCIAETLQIDEPRADEILVRIVATGLCHSDLSVMEQLQPIPLPMVLGHEGAGIVERAGEGVTHLRRGDKVVLSYLSCGRCRNCQEGHPSYCENFFQLNLSGERADGSRTLTRANGESLRGSFFSQSSFATFALCNVRNAVKLEADAPIEICGPLGCGIQTGAGTIFNVLDPSRDSTVVVFGAGAVGMSALMAAKALDCRTIIAIDRVGSRLDLATELGATHVIDTRHDDIDAALAEHSVDFCVETTGVPALVSKAIAVLNIRGVCVTLAGAAPGVTIPIELMHFNSGRKLIGAVEGDADPQEFITRLYRLYKDGRFPFDRLVTFYDFSDIEQAIADARSGVAIKPVLRMTPG